MKIEEFIEMICEKLKEELTMCEVTYEKIQKNNGTYMNGIRITRGNCNISPTIYMEPYFEEFKNGTEILAIFEDIMNCYMYAEENRPVEIGRFDDFEHVKNKIVYKLINLEKNKDLLEDTPFIAFLDLAVVFYYICDSTMHSQATILVKENHLKLWKKTKEDLFEYAVINSPKMLKASIRGMESILRDMIKEERDSPGFSIDQGEREEREEVMYVLTNEYGIFGAACLLYHQVLEAFSEKIESDFYILPSSVHEVILVPKKDEIKSKRLKTMVKEVNETEVSDRRYFI